MATWKKVLTSGGVVSSDLTTEGNNDQVLTTDGAGSLSYTSKTTNTDTWRTVTAGGNTLSTSDTLAFTAGTGISISEAAGAVTIANSVTDTNTWRTVTAGGETLGTSETLAFTAGSNVTITESGGAVTIASTDTNTGYVSGDDAELNSLTCSDINVTNLTITGTSTTIETETIALHDNIILLNSNEDSAPSVNGGLEVERGTAANTQFYWNEGDDRWEMITLRAVNEDESVTDEFSMTDVVASMRLSSVAPTSTDTSSGSYAAAMGAFWMETDTGDLYVCTDPNVDYAPPPS